MKPAPLTLETRRRTRDPVILVGTPSFAVVESPVPADPAAVADALALIVAWAVRACIPDDTPATPAED